MDIKNHGADMQAHPYVTFSLSPKDVQCLPGIAKASSKRKSKDKDEEKHKHYVLTCADSAEDARLLKQLTEMLPSVLVHSREKALDTYITDLVEVLVRQEDFAKFDRDVATDNARLRASYLKQTPTLSAEEVHKISGKTTTNKSEPASRWGREGKIFAVKHRGMNRYPAFQFKDGAPLPAIAQVLAALPESFSPWEIAFWFASGNGWLGGGTPEENLDRVDDLVTAARRAGVGAVG